MCAGRAGLRGLLRPLSPGHGRGAPGADPGSAAGTCRGCGVGKKRFWGGKRIRAALAGQGSVCPAAEPLRSVCIDIGAVPGPPPRCPRGGSRPRAAAASGAPGTGQVSFVPPVPPPTVPGPRPPAAEGPRRRAPSPPRAAPPAGRAASGGTITLNHIHRGTGKPRQPGAQGEAGKQQKLQGVASETGFYFILFFFLVPLSEAEPRRKQCPTLLPAV